jgi:hypothetical protein
MLSVYDVKIGAEPVSKAGYKCIYSYNTSPPQTIGSVKYNMC